MNKDTKNKMSLTLLGEFHAAFIACLFAGLNFRERLHHIAAFGTLNFGRFVLHRLHLVDSRQTLLAHDAPYLHSKASLYYKKLLKTSLILTLRSMLVDAGRRQRAGIRSQPPL
ncbi:uncharacterized protein METZ01_LOCUS350486, partial [marine metagenome]